MSILIVNIKFAYPSNKSGIRSLKRFKTRAAGQMSHFIVLALILVACSSESEKRSDSVDTLSTRQPEVQQVEDEPQAKTKSAPTLAAILAKHSGNLSEIRGVVRVDSVACGNTACIQITVVRRTQNILSKLPGSIEGYRVIVVEKKESH